MSENHLPQLVEKYRGEFGTTFVNGNNGRIPLNRLSKDELMGLLLFEGLKSARKTADSPVNKIAVTVERLDSDSLSHQYHDLEIRIIVDGFEMERFGLQRQADMESIKRYGIDMILSIMTETVKAYLVKYGIIPRKSGDWRDPNEWETIPDFLTIGDS